MTREAGDRHRRHVHRRDADRRGDRRVAIAKVLSTPADPSEGFMHAVERALAERRARGGAGAASSSTRRPSRRTRSSRARSRAAASSRPTASATCSRSRGRCGRRSTTRSSRSRAPLVPRDRAVGVRERLGPAGRGARRRSTTSSVRAAAALLRREGVESVAVCLLHSYVNPEHERRVGAILAEELPGVPVSLSAEVAPEFREYLRASTTVINAVIRPVVERYLERIEGRLADAGDRGEAARDAVERRRLQLRGGARSGRCSWSSRARPRA